jgi:hypothetical protein
MASLVTDAKGDLEGAAPARGNENAPGSPLHSALRALFSISGTTGIEHRRLVIKDLMEARKEKRVIFERGHTAAIMAIDGTWRRTCTMLDVSDTGAKLLIEGSLKGLSMSEFFLVLSTRGKAYRRCQLAWVNGNRAGVEFLKRGKKKVSRGPDSQ